MSSLFTVLLVAQACLFAVVVSQYGCGPDLGITNLGLGSTGSGSYGGRGEGTVSVGGDLGVSGNTGVCGAVPALGAVEFSGSVPASGSVSITGSCQCDCGSNRNAILY